MSNIIVRGLDEPVLAALKEQAERESVSFNTLVVRTLEQAAGVRSKRLLKRYHDLDHLFGTWTEEEYREFQVSTACFGGHEDGIIG